eukprot:9598049-Ditylum_brightwellii.AAC.1
MVTNPPTKEDLEKFWGKLFGKKAEHNKAASWLEVEKELVGHTPEISWANVENKELLTVVKSLKNWSTPSLDQVHNY